MKVIVCGGRDYTDRSRIFQALDQIDREECIELVIHGDARGADRLAEQWAREREVPYDPMPADWTRHGKAAGPIRNRQMILKWDPLLVIAFPGGSGTNDMCSQANEHGIRVIRISANA